MSIIMCILYNIYTQLHDLSLHVGQGFFCTAPNLVPKHPAKVAFFSRIWVPVPDSIVQAGGGTPVR